MGNNNHRFLILVCQPLQELYDDLRVFFIQISGRLISGYDF